MERSRRRFLKILGISTLGVGTISSVDLLAMVGKGEEPVYEREPDALVGKRWALVVDVKKLDEETTRKAIEACNRAHNIPQFNDKQEIKWIWTDKYEHVFPGQEATYLPEEMEKKPFLLLCNHCANPPCVRVCPTQATWQRADGIVMMDQHRCIGCR